MSCQETKQRRNQGGADIRVEDRVVSKIAGLAAKKIEGVRDLGGGASRALGPLKNP